MPYSSTDETTEAVWDEIAWTTDTGVIETMQRGNVIYVTGTLMKPDEWQKLWSYNGHVLDDGRVLCVPFKRLPADIQMWSRYYSNGPNSNATWGELYGPRG